MLSDMQWIKWKSTRYFFKFRLASAVRRRRSNQMCNFRGTNTRRKWRENGKLEEAEWGKEKAAKDMLKRGDWCRKVFFSNSTSIAPNTNWEWHNKVNNRSCVRLGVRPASARLARGTSDGGWRRGTRRETSVDLLFYSIRNFFGAFLWRKKLWRRMVLSRRDIYYPIQQFGALEPRWAHTRSSSHAGNGELRLCTDRTGPSRQNGLIE